LSCSYCCISWRTRACHIAVRPFKKQPLIVCVCRGPATRGTDNAYRGGCTVDTTTGGRAYVTRTTLRPRRPHGRRSRRRDRLLRGAGPAGRGQDVRRGRVLGHGLRHSRLAHRDRHAEAARRWHPPGALELRATRVRAGLTGRHGQRAGIAQRGLRGQRPAGGCRLGSYRGYGLVGGIGEYEGVWRMAYVRGPEGIIVSLAERIG